MMHLCNAGSWTIDIAKKTMTEETTNARYLVYVPYLNFCPCCGEKLGCSFEDNRTLFTSEELKEFEENIKQDAVVESDCKYSEKCEGFEADA